MTSRPPLHSLRKRLARLGRARRVARWTTGLSFMLLLLLVLLTALFAVDVIFQLDIFQRVTVLALTAAAFGCLCYRYIRFFFGRRETETEMALLTERIHHIDTDLVAALEFTASDASPSGSPQLREQVVRDMADQGPRLRVSQGFESHDLARSVKALAIGLSLATIGTLLLPEHISVFLRRLALSGEHYPSRTRIAQVQLNDQIVLDYDKSLRPRPARFPEQTPITFRVLCWHHSPASGKLTLWSADGSSTQHLPLVRTTGASQSNGTDSVFEAKLPPLNNSVEYQIYLGRAWTEPGLITMVPLPQLQLRAEVTAPEYTNGVQPQQISNGGLGISVLEGSDLDLQVRSTNGKPLRRVWLTLAGKEPPEQIPLRALDDTSLRWQLSSTESPLLRSVRQTVRFSISAIDCDDFSPREPLHGEIHVRPDQPPQVLTATIHRVILPTARPQFAFYVRDDYGISGLHMQIQIERRTKSESVEPAQDTSSEVHWVPIESVSMPVIHDQLPCQGQFQLDLKQWQLEPGDRLRATLEATDYRGSRAGTAVLSKPLYLEVSDEAGVLSAILEADRRTDNDLDAMIQRQLGWESEPR